MNAVAKISQEQYRSIHIWLKHHFGSATRCNNRRSCPKKYARFQWALRAGCTYDYKRENFTQFCVSCHAAYDSRHFLRGKFVERRRTLSLGNEAYLKIRYLAYDRTQKPNAIFASCILDKMILEDKRLSEI